jgi:hypothetical protein
MFRAFLALGKLAVGITTNADEVSITRIFLLKEVDKF